MSLSSLRAGAFRPGLSFGFLLILLGTLLLAGGASRENAFGQVVVRFVAFGAMFAAILFGGRSDLGGYRAVFVLLGCALLFAILQLVPLPPAIWQALPGRGVLIEAAAASGQPQPWRPLSMVPGATLNAAFSLVVPIVVVVLFAGLREQEHSWLPGVLLGMIVTAMLIGLIQFSGVQINNPFVNDVRGEVAGPFANRNHFALFLAIGCLVAPAWAFMNGREPGWRGPITVSLLILFVLTVLATGSRVGLVAVAIALVVGGIIVRRRVQRILSPYPRWVSLALLAALAALIAIFVMISVVAGRAVSIDRVFALDQGQDMRVRALPTVLQMVREYFPAGSGLGGFDPIFRLHEPFALLKVSYFNHAHNDLLEVVLDGGLPGLLFLLTAIGWWAWASIRAWRAGTDAQHVLPKLGSGILLLVIVASAFDYPARTPLMMATMTIAAIWLSHPTPPRPPVDFTRVCPSTIAP